MSVTLPNYGWDFLITGTANSTHLDSISNSTATYGSNVTSDTTDGVHINGTNDPADQVSLFAPEFSNSYSFETYTR